MNIEARMPNPDYWQWSGRHWSLWIRNSFVIRDSEFSISFPLRPLLCKKIELVSLVGVSRLGLNRDVQHEGWLMTPLANRFAAYACQLRTEDIPAPVLHEAKRRFIDSFATAVGAMDADAYSIAKLCANRVHGNPGAGIIGGGQ